MKVPVLNLKIVPEEMIIFCAKQLEPEENNFKKWLETGKIFKNAGLTPIYLCDENFVDIFITTKEKLTKKYH